MKTIATPSSRSLRMTRKSCSVSWASRLEVGSSRIRTRADEMLQRPGDRRHLLDRDGVRAERLGHVDVDVEAGEDARRPAGSSPASRSRPHRVGARPMRMFSATVRFGAEVDFLVDGADAQAPGRAAASGPRARSPSNVIVPASGRSTPVRTLMSVDLPAPFSPTSAWISPAARSKSTPSRAWTPGKAFEMPRMDRSEVRLGHGVPYIVAMLVGRSRAAARVRRCPTRGRVLA